MGRAHLVGLMALAGCGGAASEPASTSAYLFTSTTFGDSAAPVDSSVGSPLGTTTGQTGSTADTGRAEVDCTLELVGHVPTTGWGSFDLDDVVCWAAEDEDEYIHLEFQNDTMVGQWVYMEVTGDVGTPRAPMTSTSLGFLAINVFHYWTNSVSFYPMTREDGTHYQALAFRLQRGGYYLVAGSHEAAEITIRSWVCGDPPASTKTAYGYGTPGYGYSAGPPQPCE